MSNQNFWSSRHFRCKQQMTGQNRFLGFCSFMFPIDHRHSFFEVWVWKGVPYQLVDTVNQNQTVGQFRTPYCCDMKRDILYPAIQSDRREYRLHNPKIPVRAYTTFKSFQTGMGQNWAFSAYIGWKIQRMEAMKFCILYRRIWGDEMTVLGLRWGMKRGELNYLSYLAKTITWKWQQVILWFKSRMLWASPLKVITNKVPKGHFLYKKRQAS